MRVCMEPRLLPGVRWSTLKIVKSWPSCWMTMPGRSWVALTLLIVFTAVERRRLLKIAISEIPASGLLSFTAARGMTRGTLEKIASSASKQYRRADSTRSIIASFRGPSALGGALGHYFFDFSGIAGQALAQELIAGLGDEHIIFDAHAEIFFEDVDAGLHGDDHAGLERSTVLAGIVDVEADVVAETVDVILAQRFSVQVFSVGIDVIVGNFVEALASFLA